MNKLQQIYDFQRWKKIKPIYELQMKAKDALECMAEASSGLLGELVNTTITKEERQMIKECLAERATQLKTFFPTLYKKRTNTY